MLAPCTCAGASVPPPSTFGAAFARKRGVHLIEIVGRVFVVYALCMILLRISRREMSELSPMDLITMLLLSETVSPALTGGDQSLVSGAVAAAALIGCSIASEQLAFRSRRAERLIQGSALVLIDNGKVQRDVMRRFMITDDDLRATLHQHGLLRVDQVRRAFVEADGEITVIKQED